MQSKKHSLKEALSNTAVGFCITMVINGIVFQFDYFIGGMDSIFIIAQYTLIMTFVSVARQYIIRRFFNKQVVKMNESELPYDAEGLAKLEEAVRQGLQKAVDNNSGLIIVDEGVFETETDAFRLNLCYDHRQEANHSHFAKDNCDYCKLLRELDESLEHHVPLENQ